MVCVVEGEGVLVEGGRGGGGGVGAEVVLREGYRDGAIRGTGEERVSWGVLVLIRWFTYRLSLVSRLPQYLHSVDQYCCRALVKEKSELDHGDLMAVSAVWILVYVGKMAVLAHVDWSKSARAVDIVAHVGGRSYCECCGCCEQNLGRRVRVYELPASKKWSDLGTMR